MYKFLNGLMVGIVETMKVGIGMALSVGTIVGEIVKDSVEIFKEFDE